MRNFCINEMMFQFWGVEDQDNKELLNFLIKDENDLHQFMERFYDGNILKNMMAYKKYKREVSAMDKEDFMEMVEGNKKIEALERLFQEPLLSDTHIEFYMSRSNIPYDELYDKSKLLPHESLMNILTGNYVINTDKSDAFLLEL